MKKSLIITLLLAGMFLGFLNLIITLFTGELNNTLFIVSMLSILTGTILNHSS